tara:strand:+ start:598 stop:1173 length:576 start_codon:yes stop_codon:yes gene_type:complete
MSFSKKTPKSQQYNLPQQRYSISLSQFQSPPILNQYNQQLSYHQSTTPLYYNHQLPFNQPSPPPPPPSPLYYNQQLSHHQSSPLLSCHRSLPIPHYQLHPPPLQLSQHSSTHTKNEEFETSLLSQNKQHPPSPIDQHSSTHNNITDEEFEILLLKGCSDDNDVNDINNLAYMNCNITNEPPKYITDIWDKD